jgi:uncharacterized membrane protein YraQ (UPF0718 family)
MNATSLYHSFLSRFYGSYTQRILWEIVVLLDKLWPYLLAGIAISTLLKFTLSKQWIAGFFRNYPKRSIALAACLGVVSPLGSYVVIPLSASLFRIGVPFPVIIAFMVSSPLISPELFLMTVGAFGYPLALVRMASSLVLGLSAGALGLAFQKVLPGPIKSGQPQFEKEEGVPVTVALFVKSFFHTGRYIGKYFLLAIVLAAVIKVVIPFKWFEFLFGFHPFLVVLFSAGAGLPFYMCGGAAIPLVLRLSEMGLSQGAVLAFFISGPLTRISNLILVESAFNTRVLVYYLAIGFTGALILGLIFNFV